MESIVQFAFPEVTCRFALRKRGRRKYGLLADLLDSGMGMPSTVGMMDGTDMLREDLRRSTTYSTHIDFDIEELNPDQVEDHLSKLVPDGSTLLWPFSGSYNVIEYGVGGFLITCQTLIQTLTFLLIDTSTTKNTVHCRLVGNDRVTKRR